jgi:hypothetical protein
MMAQVDDGIHRVVGALKERGFWDNTALVFLSDNGAMPYGGGNNFPYRGMKSGSWEGGVRTLAFIRGPPRLFTGKGPGEPFKAPLHITDIAPTLVAISDALGEEDRGHGGSAPAPPAAARFDGRNMLGTLQRGGDGSEGGEEAGIVLQHDPYVNNSAFLKGRYKLVLGPPGLPFVFQEPTSNWRANTDGSDEGRYGDPGWAAVLTHGTVAEATADIVEDLTGNDGHGAKLVIISYVVAMFRGVLRDWITGTHYRNLLLSKERNFAATSIAVRDSCPTIEWGEGVTTGTLLLFDVVADPQERDNLASTFPEKVETLHRELCDILGRSEYVMQAV